MTFAAGFTDFTVALVAVLVVDFVVAVVDLVVFFVVGVAPQLGTDEAKINTKTPPQ